MKKCYVLLGLLLAVAFLLPQGVFAAENSTNVTITANTLARIELDCTGQPGELGLDVNSDNENDLLQFNVKSNVGYYMTVQDNNATVSGHKGHMVSCEDGTFTYNSAVFLEQPFEIMANATPPGWSDLEVDPVTVVYETSGTTNLGDTSNVTFRQDVGFGDHVLGGVNVYQIVLRFTASSI